MVVHPQEAEPFTLKAFLIGYSCDLPARAIVQNFMQFNGYHGCGFCEQPGKTITTRKGGHVHVFPYQKNSPKEPRRTHQGTLMNATLAVTQHTVVSF